MRKDKELVSVIIRTKDRPEMLQRAIDSVCSQIYENIEIVVVNDGGQDVSKIIEHYKNTFNNVPGVSTNRTFVYIHNKRSVMRASAANIGLESSNGEYMCLLDDDDYFMKDHIQLHVDAQKKSGKLISISKCVESIERQEKDGKINENTRLYHYPNDLNRIMFYFFENYFPSNSLVFHRNLVEKVGKFDPKLFVLEDWDMWVRMLVEESPTFVDKVTAVYTTRSGGSNVRMAFDQKDTWKEAYKYVMDKYRKLYKEKEVSVPLSEISNFLSNHAVEWYCLTKENEELRDSFAYKIYRSRYYRILKRIGRVFHTTRG